MLNLFHLKTFLMRIKFYFLFFNLNIYINIQNFMIFYSTFSTWMVHITYALLDYHSVKFISKAHI